MSESSPSTNASAAGASLRRPRSIAFFLFMLALVALLPAFAFSAILLQRNNEARERVVDALITGTARSIMQSVEREIIANISTLKVLATTKTLEDGDLEAFYRQVKTALAGTNTYVYALDTDFMTILSTRSEFGAPPVRANDVETARRALETGDIAISGLVAGRVSHDMVFNVLYPVKVGALAPFALAISRSARSLEQALLSDKLPEGWNVAMVDAADTILAGSPDGATTGDHLDIADLSGLRTTPGLITIKAADDTYRAVVRQSALTGWTLIAWAPSATIAKPLTEAVLSLAVGGLVLAAIVIIVVYWLVLLIGRSVRGLETDAKRLGAGEPVVAREYPISEIASISRAIEDASKHRLAAEAEVRFLMRELAHRSKNQMTVIAAMAKQTARGAEDVTEFVQNFEKRIFGLARSTDLLLANGLAGVDLRELVSRQIEPFCPVDGTRAKIDGPDIRLNTQAAQILGMAAHELATNAVKYGAFLKDSGRLKVGWSRAGDNLDLSWRETVETPSPQSDRRGFGTTVLESMVGTSLGAEVERIVHPDGIEWRFSIPVSGLDPRAVPADAASGTDS